MAGPRARWSRQLFFVVVTALALYVVVRTTEPSAEGDTRLAVPSSAAPAPSPSPSTASAPAGYEPADYAAEVRKWAGRTGVDARLVMAVLYNEAYKPHDPEIERAWQKYKPDASFGIANMHRATFDAVKQGRDFAGRSWEELPDDRSLAIESEAWYLHDLAARLPSKWTGPYTKDELLALGYNAGEGNMLAFARGVEPGSQARSYLGRLRANWDRAGEALG